MSDVDIYVKRVQENLKKLCGPDGYLGEGEANLIRRNYNIGQPPSPENLAKSLAERRNRHKRFFGT